MKKISTRFFFLLLPANMLLSGVCITSCNSTSENKNDSTKIIVRDADARLHHNHYNALHLKADSTNIQQLIAYYSQLSVASINEKLNTDTSLNETSFLIYFLARKTFADDTLNGYQKGLELYHIAADDYLNPVAMIDLAKIYFRNGSDISRMFPHQTISHEQDYRKAYYYVSLAFTIANNVKDKTNNDYLLNLVVNNGLGLLDSFQSSEIRSVFNIDTDTKDIDAKISEAEGAFLKMYFGK